MLSGVLERRGVPLVVVFLALGAALGPAGLNVLDVGLASPSLRVLATLALTLVLFSDAVTLDLREIRTQRSLVLRVLGPGTVLPAAVIALAGLWLLDLSLPAAAIVGCALASTDPVLLRSVLRSRALPTAPRLALRIESGMNDAVLLPVVMLALGAMGGEPLAGDELRRHLVGLFILGPALGALVGWLGIVILGQIRDRVGVRRDYESIYALGLALSAYAVAESVGGSGFLAAFFAGVMVAVQDVELCDCFLEYGEATSEMLLLLTFVALGTSLIWKGLSIVGWRTLVFAAIALVARTVVVYPMLAGGGLTKRDRRIIALFGPRGLSSLLLVLLPVFAGIQGAEDLFTITALVVLVSVVLHGGGIAAFVRRNDRGLDASPVAALPGEVSPGEPSQGAVSSGKAPHGAVSSGKAPQGAMSSGGAPPGAASPVRQRELPVHDDAPAVDDERITLDQVRALQARGEPVIMVDARADRSYRADPRAALGAIRLDPYEPVRDATAMRLTRTSTLVVYCA